MEEVDAKQDLEDHLRPAGGPSNDPEYLAWKEAKIRRALEQSKDRTQMIPAHKVWEKFGLER